MVHIEEVPDTTTAIQDNTSHEFSSSRTIETAQLLPNFVGKVLKSGDGLVSVPFLSRMYNWSYNVAWMSKVDPSTWIFETRLELARRPNRNLTTCLNSVIIPVIDFLVHRNRCMIDLNQDSDMPSHLQILDSSESYLVDQGVVKIAFGNVSNLDDVGREDSGSLYSSVCTAHILTQLLDKLIWVSELRKKGNGPSIICIDDGDDEVEEPLAMDHHYSNTTNEERKGKINDVVAWYNKIHVGWKAVVESFIKNWDASELLRNQRRSQQENDLQNSSNLPTTTFLKSMYENTVAAEGKSDIAKSLARINDAVLALASFRLFDLKAALANQNKKKEFNFHKEIL